MESKGPEWVERWKNQGIYPDNPWYPSFVSRSPDGLFDAPLYRCLIELGDFNGAMYWTYKQLRNEVEVELGCDPLTRDIEAEYRIRHFEKFILEVEAMQDRTRFSREYAEEHKDLFFNPLEDLSEQEVEQELRYAAQAVADRKQKLLKLLGKEALNENALNEHVICHEFLSSRHFERQFQKYKGVAFSKTVAKWKKDNEREIQEKNEEDARIDSQAKRTHKDTIIVAYRDFLGLVFPPAWLNREDIDAAIDPVEVRELGMYTADLRARQREVVKAGVHVEYNLQQIEAEDRQLNFWFEVEAIYRRHMAEHLGITAEEVDQQIRKLVKCPEGPHRYDPQHWNTIFQPAGPDWVKEKPSLYSFNAYEAEHLVKKCKEHHLEVQKLEGKAWQLFQVDLSDQSREFALESIRLDIDRRLREWVITRRLITELGYDEWKEKYDTKKEPPRPKDEDLSYTQDEFSQFDDDDLSDSDFAIELEIARINLLRKNLERSGMPQYRMETECDEEEEWYGTSTRKDKLAFAKDDTSARPIATPSVGPEDSLRQGLADSSSLLGGPPSKPRRKIRSLHESLNRPFGPVKQNSKTQSKPQSKPKSKPHSKPNNYGFQSFEEDGTAPYVPTGNPAIERERLRQQQSSLPPPRRQNLTATGQTGGRGPVNLDQWPDFSEIITPGEPISGNERRTRRGFE
ncbi:hypothetical protein TWF506_004018 [Arthrobotrys conoides]|uniref:Uncharacterized protein n=1 Tax=Arthrobotrys conoides TaxID=74498 RepID=A0AAN8NAT1_9PEZI